MLDRRQERSQEEVELAQVVDRSTLLEMQQAVEQVHIEESLGYYIVDLVVATRSAPGVQVGASPRGSLALLKLSRCRAALSGRDYVTPDDVKAIAVPSLAHRLALKPELWVERLRSDDIVRELLDQVPTPAVEQQPAL
jgi:MoxR-like ATPase